MSMSETRPDLTIRLCGPRGFCAGVDRAIQIVVLALKAYGAPVYVRHEIVHNRYVVEGLEAKGAIFVEELDEIPEEHRQQPVVFSAHGVPKSVPADAMARNLSYELRDAYDAALVEYDVLVMPTLPYVARELPSPDVSLADYLDTALSMIGNTAPTIRNA